ncbi:heterokaryon incompatibility protein-domain-containing protein [Chaetomium sp. MPI-CAGE-AT-0009]|nr:heterokaryon incompatibility protein-domain-containing protein [Chaetomium sp. MPI-CAGE-AT-0009]
MPSTDPCAICARVEFHFDEEYFECRGMQKPPESEERRLSQRLATKLFHKECAHCRSSADDPDPNLCPFCRHLRLRHLLCCVAATERHMSVAIGVCRFEDVPERTSACSFCRLVVRAGLPYGYFSGVRPASEYKGDLLTILVESRGFVGAWRYYDNRLQSDPRLIRYSGGPPLSRGVRWTEIVDSEDDVHDPAKYKRNWKTPEVERAVGRRVDFLLADRWLNNCLQHHDRCAMLRPGASITLPANFRVIDVKNRRLVQMSPGCEFAALSYVWGHDPDPTKLVTTRLNMKALQEEGGLAARYMPATIEDAMEVCRQLKEPYLWVDRFCIAQDDNDDKVEQIAAMAAIYSLAKLVIIVADGNSDSGIAGVSRDGSQGQVHDRIAGLDFRLGDLPFWDNINRRECIWSTRGWTYQEDVLAQRKLVLTESQAFFKCRENVLHEDGYSSSRGGYPVVEFCTQPWHDTLVETFYGHLSNYRPRLLTNASDIYSAIDGVANALYGGLGSLWRGLPRRDFDRALLWCINWGFSTKSWVTGPASNGTRPSWSWSVTDRRIRLLGFNGFSDALRYRETLVAWAGVRQEADGPTQRVLESVETISGGKPLSQFYKGQDKCDCPGELSAV